MTTVAVIQPYFFPYAGYFRLFAAADIVVIFDCVQFPRRGWVHRNRFTTASGVEEWLTLPLEHAPQNTPISEMRFTVDAAQRIEDLVRKFPLLDESRMHPLMRMVLQPSTPKLSEYLIEQIERVTQLLDIQRRIVRSSTLDIPEDLRGQARVIEIVKRLEGSMYVNPSGGRELYDHPAFAASGLTLRFLTPYTHDTASVLTRILREPANAISSDINETTVLVP